MAKVCSIGGQAVMEGVMMKNKDKAAFMLAILQNMFKHSKQTITMRYIGLQADDERNIYESLCL